MVFYWISCFVGFLILKLNIGLLVGYWFEHRLFVSECMNESVNKVEQQPKNVEFELETVALIR